MNVLVWALGAVLLLQDAAGLPPAPEPLPPPPAQETPAVTPPVDGDPPATTRRRRRKKPPAEATPSPRKTTPPPSTRRRRPDGSTGTAPRRKVEAPARVERPNPWLPNLRAAPLSTRERLMVLAAQGACAVVGVVGTLGLTGGAALVGRTLDRPAGGLARAPIPLGGTLPLLVGVTAGALATSACVAGVGLLAERRILAPAAAATGVVTALLVGLSGGIAVIAWPMANTTRNFAIRENAMAWTLIGFAVGAPLLAVLGWHLGAMLQQWQEREQFKADVQAAELALVDDARKAEEKARQPQPEPPPMVEPVPDAPAPDVVPAPQPQPTPEPSPEPAVPPVEPAPTVDAVPEPPPSSTPQAP